MEVIIDIVTAFWYLIRLLFEKGLPMFFEEGLPMNARLMLQEMSKFPVLRAVLDFLSRSIPANYLLPTAVGGVVLMLVLVPLQANRLCKPKPRIRTMRKLKRELLPRLMNQLLNVALFTVMMAVGFLDGLIWALWFVQ